MIIIPARLKSTRFPNKILAPINGIAMCIYTALQAKKVDETIIVTDSDEVINLAKEHNIKCVKSINEHNSGTERIKEAADILGLDDDEIIINLQADEPLFEKQNLLLFKDFANKYKDEFFMASCFSKINDYKDANAVKVVLDKDNYALYFSRANIPFNRDNTSNLIYLHLGIYAYSYKALKEFVSFTSVLENIEKLEQLRALENGKKIKMLEINTKSFGIDTKEDYERLMKSL